MTTINKFLKNAGKFIILAAVMANAQGAITDIAQAPLITSSSSTLSVKPNVFLMMDDSGSMDWSHMPDDAADSGSIMPMTYGYYGYRSSQCNGVYYDPTINYYAPVKADGTSYPDAIFTSAWTNGYNTGAGTVNLSTNYKATDSGSISNQDTTGVAGYYYSYTGSQTTEILKNYYVSTSTFFKECSSARSSVTITVGGSGSTTVTSITVNNTPATTITSGGTAASTSTTALAAAIASNITLAGYSASASGNVVTIDAGNNSAGRVPTINKTGTMTFTVAGTFTNPAPAAAGRFTRVTVSSSSGPSGVDERTNFANWYSYYSTRLNMMKTSAGLAFKSICPITNPATPCNYRVGFATMNNNSGTDFVNLAPFVDTTSPVSTQRTDFYAKLYATSPGNSTPLLKALSSAGRMYGHKLPSNKLNTVAANDPIEYSCQQNFTILSTDGFWNDATNSDLTGASVGNQDDTEVRPMFDGASTTIKTVTPTTTVVQTQTVQNFSTITWTRTVTTVGSSCGGVNHNVTQQQQTATQPVIGGTTTSVDNATTVDTSTVTTINGLSGAPVVTTVGPTSTNVGIVTAVTSSGSIGAYTNTGAPISSCSAAAAGTSTPNSTDNYTSSNPTPLSTTVTVGTPVVTVTSSGGGTSNTLADVAEYYYVTDIRDASLANATGALGTNVTLNNVPTSGLDAASWQHMTTFTLGLGARGKMVFSPSYQNDSSGDFFSVKHGLLADSTQSPAICSWQPNGTTCNWPAPSSAGIPENIDDLWHAAVNGRGSYFSATNPSTLSTGISTALAGVSARTGSSASASISNPNISMGDNFIFSSQFVSQEWDGQVIRQQMNLTTGALSSVIDWDAGALLDTNTSRNVYAFSGTSANGLQAFNSTNFGSNANFTTPNISSLSQFCVTGISCLTSTQQTAAAGANLVAYLAGDRTNEGYPADLTKYFRQRVHLLGDIVDSQASYVKAPLLLYSDIGYSAFVTAKANRQSMIYVGANDGMLHAFYATSDLMDNATGDVVTTGGVSVTGGAEAWAFVPTAVMPNLYKLADINYTTNHQYFVDGSPVTTDICPTTPAVQCGGTTSTTTTWKTILVGGLNAGGRSYFAMDITNPAAPKALWEFTNANLGFSYGNPQIVKLGGTGTGSLAAGTWVVLLTSGYNNADGKGHLFVLNAYTGVLLLDISTGVGSAATPSGLSKIVAQVVNPSLDATVLQVYGGDLFGNLWRFDVNGNVGAAGYDAQLLAVLKGPTGLAQPITTKPEIGLINGKVVVDVGTGRYLGNSDINGTDTTQLSPNLQTMYGIMDPLLTNTTPSVAIYPNPRTLATNPFVKQTEFTTTCPLGAPATLCTFGQIIRTSTDNAVNIPANSGWYVDFPDSGERLNTDPTLELGMLAFNTNVPGATACTIGGDSYNYVLDYTTGSFPTNSVTTITAAIAATLPAGMAFLQPNGTYIMGIVAGKHAGSLSTAPIFISLPNGNKALCTNDSNGVLICRPVNTPPPPGGARRVSWRQLLTQ